MREPAPGSRMAAVRRWAAILLPFVIAARAVLFVFQLRDERSERAHANDPPPWPPVAGEELRFRSSRTHVADWAEATDRPRFLVAVTQRDYLPADPGTGCMIDPAALVRHHGTLTLRSRTPGGDWRAEWSGGATMPTPAEVLEGEPDSHAREVETNMLRAMDCGGDAHVELGEWDVHALVNLLAGEPRPPASERPEPRQDLRIPVEGPPP